MPQRRLPATSAPPWAARIRPKFASAAAWQRTPYAPRASKPNATHSQPRCSPVRRCRSRRLRLGRIAGSIVQRSWCASVSGPDVGRGTPPGRRRSRDPRPTLTYPKAAGLEIASVPGTELCHGSDGSVPWPPHCQAVMIAFVAVHHRSVSPPSSAFGPCRPCANHGARGQLEPRLPPRRRAADKDSHSTDRTLRSAPRRGRRWSRRRLHLRNPQEPRGPR
jgi:hypothetical protein